MTLAEKIYNCFKKRDCFSLTEAYEENIVKPRETMRARIYDNLVIRFERIIVVPLSRPLIKQI